MSGTTPDATDLSRRADVSAAPPPAEPVGDELVEEFSLRVARVERELAELRAELSALAAELGNGGTRALA